MIKHLFKLVWNRKRMNILIITEIFFSFLVLFALSTLIVYTANNYRHPLGFDYTHVWNISLGSREVKASSPEEIRQIFLALRRLPEIEAAAGIQMQPFGDGQWMSNAHYKGRDVDSYCNAATDEFARVMSIEVTQGRWFTSSDDALAYDPVVINQRLSRELFGQEDPLGKTISSPEFKGRVRRVVGVMTDFRQDGELAGLPNYYFSRLILTRLPGADASEKAGDDFVNAEIKLRAGTTAAFEERLMTRLQSVAKDRNFQIKPLAQARKSAMEIRMAFLIAGALVAGFLIVMVGLGMVGVLWQSVSRRTSEIGLRRAVGATARKVHAQVLGEMLVIASIGLLIGTMVAVQFPLLGLMSWFSVQVYAIALAISLFLIYLLTIVSGLYPSWLATKVQPADVLRYE